ncbi:lipocalin-like protein [Christiangramia gaetbulicola]|uniref:Lipocalin-like protein n=1 Tax=Christiangramia gaetbulicola TaxID=703340 RepID=A0A2T6AF28_9FLAO|nr:lipocalin family protein [Christiangramia gaetbulicola]PTX42424.1 lipocalin-like protein [Christiangramia gaetbulicola]
MKKFLILFLAMSLFTACSDDDDSGAEGNIVGTWTLVAATNVPGFTIDDCTGRSTITFNADNTASSTFYATVEDQCVSSNDSGTWSNSSGSQYTIKIPGFDDPVAGTVNFSNENRFTFTPNDLPTSSLTFARN